MPITQDMITAYFNENTAKLDEIIATELKNKPEADEEAIAKDVYVEWREDVYSDLVEKLEANDPDKKPTAKRALLPEIDKTAKKLGTTEIIKSKISEERAKLPTPSQEPPVAAQASPDAAAQEPPVVPAQVSPAAASQEPTPDAIEVIVPEDKPAPEISKTIEFINANIEKAVTFIVSIKISKTWRDADNTAALMALKNLASKENLAISPEQVKILLDNKETIDKIKVKGEELSAQITDAQIEERAKARRDKQLQQAREKHVREQQEREKNEKIKQEQENEAIKIAAASAAAEGDEEFAKSLAAEEEAQAAARAVADDEAVREPDAAIVEQLIPDQNNNEYEDEEIARALAASFAAEDLRRPLANRNNNQDEELARALAASLAPENLGRPSANSNNNQDEELQRALALSKKEAEEAQKKKQPAAPKPVNNVPPAPAQPSTDTAIDKVNLYIAELKKKSLHKGTFYGRSNQIAKQVIAKDAQTLLNSSMSDKEKLVLIKTYIRKNRKETGIPFLHDHPGDLASTLKLAEQELIERLKTQPYQVQLAKLESYINTAEEKYDEKALTQGLKVGSFVIKSNQLAKLGLAKTLKANCAALNSATSRTDLEKISALLEKEINLNTRLTGDNFLHKKGQLHEILEDLKAEVDSKIKEMKVAARR